jgi:hypothetical protein
MRGINTPKVLKDIIDTNYGKRRPGVISKTSTPLAHSRLAYRIKTLRLSAARTIVVITGNRRPRFRRDKTNPESSHFATGTPLNAGDCRRSSTPSPYYSNLKISQHTPVRNEGPRFVKICFAAAYEYFNRLWILPSGGVAPLAQSVGSEL